ncbi:hypothetical protein CCC_00860 [Paramagnetospirillum magnetotacticum MS-1]|uniref:Glycosyltransferase RgtA/B/C/D-like domain-containing protein n=1 Tax=Paramagnetospirillum magnetotacticum MS-1 TaxID=272627 RepID=A0A0C2YDK8_PARME|nr:glycosyltransferase family 39 protein [Paramagnetospirillum magnetotacticum]KIL97799.1 hypothetical protein CCC_00860 [Paramagnetospirillum magnetotacticum MS-1]
MTTTLVLALMGGGMLGWGLMLDRLLGCGGLAAERLSRSLVLGFGVLGWLAFFPALFHHLDAVVLAAVPGAGLPGLWLLRGFSPPKGERLTVWTWTLGGLIAALAFGDFLEGLSPPADADSLAYHFANPKLFLENGGMVFIPRASDGAAPLLPQMTYMLALGLGGERALTLWCMLTGWLLPIAVFGVARRYLDRDWSLAAGALTLSLPTIIYSAGTGQVEVRTAAFVLVAASAAADSLGKRSLRAAGLAGIAAGLFLGSKYTALMFIAAMGLVLLAGRGWFLRCAVFGLATLAAGGQWYLWNYWNTGDPVYPMLFSLLPYRDGVPWSAAQAAYMREAFFGSEILLPQTLWWWLAYPFRVLVDGHPGFEAGRTGLGPFPLLALPFAIAGAWRQRRSLAASPLTPMLAIAALFYAAWFFFGTSQRIRHYVPIVPIVLIVLMVASERATRGRSSRLALGAGLAMSLILQLGAQGLVASNHARRLLTGEGRDAFLLRNTPAFGAVQWVDGMLRPTDKVLTLRRELIYLFETPVFYAHPHVEARVETRPDNDDPAHYLAQLRRQGVTHILVGPSSVKTYSADSSGMMAEALISRGCARELGMHRTGSLYGSRTLDGPSPTISWYWYLIAIAPAPCPLDP